MRWLRAALGRREAPAAPPPEAVSSAQWKARGNAALTSGDLAEAARCYEQGLLADAGDPSLRLNHGFVLLEQGHADAAAQRLEQAIALHRPGDDFLHEAHYLLGRAQAARGDFAAALRSSQEAVRIRPDFAEAQEAGMHALGQLGRPGEAVEWARRLAALRPGPAARLMLAKQLCLARQYDEAAALMEQLCAEDPRDVDAGALLFEALQESGRLEAALKEGERLLALTGPQPAALVGLSVVLAKLGRLEEALARLEHALQLEPGRREALVNRVTVLTGLSRLPEAVAHAEAALRQHPDDGDLHWALCIARLLEGDFARGWQEHEWRDRSGAYRGSLPRYAQPRWQGESLAGKAIFLYGEQGFGDNIQFVRYVPLVAQQAAQVYVQVPQSLEPLMTALPANCRLLPQGARLPAIDLHCPLMSVPAVLRTVEATIPNRVPYLQADPQRVQRWRERLPGDALNVGVAWSGKPTYSEDHNRSMRLATFRALAASGCRFVTVQPELRPADREELPRWPQLLDLGRELRHFGDTAAMMEALDIVVSTDTSVVHLAGALGRPVWVLLAHVPDWRWMLEREDSPWYPTARLFRQGADRRWEPVLERVRAELAALAAAR